VGGGGGGFDCQMELTQDCVYRKALSSVCAAYLSHLRSLCVKFGYTEGCGYVLLRIYDVQNIHSFHKVL